MLMCMVSHTHFSIVSRCALASLRRLSWAPSFRKRGQEQDEPSNFPCLFIDANRVAAVIPE